MDGLLVDSIQIFEMHVDFLDNCERLTRIQSWMMTTGAEFEFSDCACCHCWRFCRLADQLIKWPGMLRIFFPPASSVWLPFSHGFSVSNRIDVIPFLSPHDLLLYLNL